MNVSEKAKGSIEVKELGVGGVGIRGLESNGKNTINTMQR